MNYIDGIGFLAAISTSSAFLPQAIKVIKTGDTSSLSLSMYIIFTFGVSMWLAYGWMQDDYPIVIANAVTLTFSSIILGITIRNHWRNAALKRHQHPQQK